MQTIVKTTLLLVSILMLFSCASGGQKLTAESVKRNGLVTAKLTSNYQIYKIYTGDVKISGKNYPAAISDGGFLRLSLKPGTYVVEEFSSRRGDYIRRYPVTAEFTVYPGQVTNLGSVVLKFDSANTDKFSTLFIDNSNDISAYLKRHYPGIYGVVSAKKIRLANVKYVSHDNLNKVKVSLINKESIWGTNYFAGVLGSLATFTRDANNRAKNLRWVDTGTLNDITNCKVSGTRFYCIVESTEKGHVLYAGEGGKFYQRNLPVELSGIGVDLFGKKVIDLLGNKEVVLVTDEIEIYTSRDQGKSWIRNNDFKRAVERTSLLGIDTTERRSHTFYAGNNGYYFYTSGDYGLLLYRPAGSLAFQKLSLPPERENIKHLVETDFGLYEGPDFTIFGDSSINFLAKGSRQWVKYDIPAGSCQNIEVLDRKSDALSVTCSGKYMVTQNQGKTWHEALRSEVNKLKAN